MRRCSGLANVRGAVRPRISCVLCILLLTACASRPNASLQERRPSADSQQDRIAPRPPTEWIELSAGTTGPYVQWLGERAVLAWAEPEVCEVADSCGVSWVAQWSDDSGRFPRQPVLLRENAQQPARARLNQETGGASMLLNVSESDGGYAVEAQQIGDTPGQAGAPTVVGTSDLAIPWADAVSTGTGHVVLWAAGSAEAAITAQALGPTLNPAGAPSTVAEEVVAWQVVRLGDNPLLGTVHGDGSVHLLTLETNGKVRQRLEVLPPGSTNPDIDLVTTGSDRVTLTVSRRSLGESRIMVAHSTGDKLLTEPALLTQGAGTELSLGLYSDGKRAFALIHQPNISPGTLQLVAAEPNQQAREALHIPFHANLEVPLVSVHEEGVDVLYWDCEGGTPCENPKQPMLLRSSLALVPISVTPFTSNKIRPDLVWDLNCQSSQCRASMATFDTRPNAEVPVRFRFINNQNFNSLDTIPSHVGRKQRFASFRSVLTPPELAGLDAVKTSKGNLLAWLSYFDPNTPYQLRSKPASDGRKEPLRATLKLRRFSTPGSGDTPIDKTISLRARSRSGVDLATNGDEHLLLWSSLQKGQGQVFLTLLDGQGKRRKQRMLTRSRGDVYAVAAAATRDGWWVTWIDDRKQPARAYATLVSKTLVRRSKDMPIPTLSGKKSHRFTATALDTQVRDGKRFVLLTESSPDARISRVREVSYNAKSRTWQRGPVISSDKRLAHAARYARGNQAGRIFWATETKAGNHRLAYAESGEVGLGSVQLLPLEEIRGLDAHCGPSSCRVLASGLATSVTPGVSSPWLVQAQVSAAPGRITVQRTEKIAALEKPLTLSVPVVQHERTFWFYDSSSTPRVMQGQ